MNYEPNVVEQKILKFWKDKSIYKKQKNKGRHGKKFYFLQGPPYTSGRFHVGHAWNHSLKDCVLRYKRMNGFDVWDRGGWDMHGLPTSIKVQEKFGLVSKDDIEKFGVNKFVMECENYSKEMMKTMTEDLIKWGVWLDHENAYQPITKEFMEGVWWCISEAHKNGYLYEGDKVMAWDTETETVAAKHELEYKEVTEDSIFLKLKVENKENEYLIVWTTTPWTIPFNLAVMANPDIDYVKVNVGGEVWILASDIEKSIFDVLKLNHEVTDKISGKKLEGMSYEPLLGAEIPILNDFKKNYNWAFKVILSKEYVDTTTGSGLVHCAPGCGPEDQEVGSKYKLPTFNETNAKGIFSKKMGKFEGMTARVDDHKFTEYFEQKGVLVAKIKYKHEYPYHQRTKKPVIFRATKQWFFAVENLKKKMHEWNKEIKWIPDWAGGRTFDDWLKNLKDIGITRQMYWGTPIPIWRCGSCKEILIFGSLKDLQKYSKIPSNIHKPWIDEVKFKCPKCKKGFMSRIPDVGDVWMDAGCTSWISLYFPQKKELLKKYWPADFITEGKDQIRGWFNLLFDTSAVSFGKLPFLNCYMHGFITDIEGEKMSKSKGNVVSPYDVCGKWGADTMRYYMNAATQPGLDMNFNLKDIETRFKNLCIFWNTVNFLIDFVKNSKISLRGKMKLDVEEKYILSRTNKTIKLVTEMFDNYRLNEIPDKIEQLYLDLSRIYIKSIREKSNEGTNEEKLAIVNTIFECLTSTLKIFAPVAPFITEELYHQMRQQFKLKEESVHLFDWPKYDKKMIDEDLEKSFNISNEILTSILAARDKGKIGIRWPLQKVTIYTEDEEYTKAIELLKEFILNQCNLKELVVTKTKPVWVTTLVKINYDVIAPRAKEKLPKIVSRFVEISAEAIKSSLLKKGKFELAVEDWTFKLQKDDVYFVDQVPTNVASTEFSKGVVYLDLIQTSDLLSEGFVREITRKIQSMRKDAAMIRAQKANIVVATEDKVLKHTIEKYANDISTRTNTSLRITFGNSTDEKINESFEVKNKKIKIGLSPK